MRLGMASRWPTSAGPEYQGAFAEASVHVVSVPGRYGNRPRLDETKRRHGRKEGGFDLAEPGLAPVDQIHLVDSKHHAGNAHQRQDRGVAARLLLQAVTGIDQHNRRVRVARAARHVAGILVMAGAIDQDETAPRRVEVTPGHVDRDALLTFRYEAVEQKAVIELVRIARGPCRAPHHFALVVRKFGSIPQKPADQRRFAVIDRAACEDMDDAAILRPRRGGIFSFFLRRSSEVSILFLALHGARFIVIDEPALPLGRARCQRLGNHAFDVRRA